MPASQILPARNKDKLGNGLANVTQGARISSAASNATRVSQTILDGKQRKWQTLGA